MDERPGFGLYVHWPFCQAKCPYCDFNSHVRAEIDEKAWIRAYSSEIARVAEETGGRVLRTIFFGGGTPSLMSPELVARIIDDARAAWRPANDLEITLEANPTSVEAARFRAFRAAGVNRVSVGLQSLRDADLRSLGRMHSADEGRRAFALARETFPRASFDLIYARQDQTLAEWEAELAEALALGADHVSLYQLTIEQGTVFHQRLSRGGLRGLPDEDLAADLFHLTQDMTAAAGLPAYEISNHARPGQEARHNMIYWQSGDWAGIGPGAHGRLTLDGARIATEAHREPGRWLDAATGGSGEVRRETLTARDAQEERLMMGLRLTDGIALADLPRIDEKINVINGLAETPLIEVSGGRLCLTPAGRPLLNAVLRSLLA